MNAFLRGLLFIVITGFLSVLVLVTFKAIDEIIEARQNAAKAEVEHPYHYRSRLYTGSGELILQVNTKTSPSLGGGYWWSTEKDIRFSGTVVVQRIPGEIYEDKEDAIDSDILP